MGKTTDNLLNQLSAMNSLSELRDYTAAVEKAEHKINLHEYLNDLIRKSGLSAGQVIQRSGIQRNYGYQILDGTKHPGRDKVLALGMALGLPLDEVQRILAIAKEGILYPKCKRDSILIFCINRSMCVQEANELLFEMGETPL